MPLESITSGIEDLNASWPTGVDPISQGDDHDRLTKQAIQLSFPNTQGAWNVLQQIAMQGADMGGFRVQNVATPVDDTDAVRKGDTDALLARIVALESQAATFQSFGVYDGVNEVILGGSGDFSVVKESTGVYTFTFNEFAASLNSQALVANNYGLFNAGADAFYVIATSVNTWQITCYSSNGNFTDTNFSFIRQAD